jgi:hypothetical protein
LIKTPDSFVDTDYDFVANAVIDHFNKLIKTQPQIAGNIAGCMVRTAGHDFMDFRIDVNGKQVGGSDACMNFLDPDNNGIP